MTYILEGGNVIVKQPDGEAVKIEAGIAIKNESTEIKINYGFPIFSGVSGKNSTTGYKNCFIRTNYSSQYVYSGSTTFIRIYTDHLDAWNASFNKLLEEEVKNGYIVIEKRPIGSPEYLSITPGSKSIYIELTVIYIGVQIGPGTVII